MEAEYPVIDEEELYVFKGWRKGHPRFEKCKGWRTGACLEQFTYLVKEDKSGTKHFDSVDLDETGATLGKAFGRLKSNLLYRIRSIEAELKRLNTDYERLLATTPVEIKKGEQ